MLNFANFPQKMMNNSKKINNAKYHSLSSNVYEQLVNPTPIIRYYFLLNPNAIPKTK